MEVGTPHLHRYTLLPLACKKNSLLWTKFLVFEVADTQGFETNLDVLRNRNRKL